MFLYKALTFKTLINKFNYKNNHQVPKLVKIQLNRGLGVDGQNNKILQKSNEEIRLITGQQPIVTRAKKSIAGFKVREEMILGVTVTLRNKKMYAFLEKLIHIVLPRIRDFRGLSLKGFDRNGNYHFGLKEQLVFPEISYDNVEQVKGQNISFVTTTAKTKSEGIALLKEFGFFFRRVYKIMLEGTFSIVRLPCSRTNNRRHITHRAHVFIRLCLMEPFLLFFWHTTEQTLTRGHTMQRVKNLFI